MASQNMALRKRTQIANANRTMFLWVAGISIVFGFSVVASYFLVDALIYNERVIGKKESTVRTLKQNIENVDPSKNKDSLTNEVRLLDTNEDLMSIRAGTDDKALQVILDALPSEANSLALGASLQKVLLGSVTGIEIYSLKVDPVEGVEALDSDRSVVNASKSSDSDNSISFRFTVYGSKENLKKVLENLEKSIRTIDITSLKYEDLGDKSTLIVQAKAFYEPVKTVDLKDEKVK